MSEQGAKPEVLPGDLITRPGLYESRGGDIVRITGWDDGWWVSEWHGTVDWYGSDGRQRFDGGLEPNRWQLLHWVGPLPASDAEPETTSEQLAEIEGQATDYTPLDGWQLVPLGETPRDGDQWAASVGRFIRPIEPEPQPQPQPQPVQVREGRWRTRNGEIRNVTPTPECDGRAERFPWWDAQYAQTWRANGRYHFGEESPLDLVAYLGPIEPQPEPQPEPQATDYTPPEGWRLLEVGEEVDIPGRDQYVIESRRYIRPIDPQPPAQPVQVREGRWKTRGGQEVQVTAMPTDHDDFAAAYPWWDGDVTTWANDGVFFSSQTAAKDLVTYLGPIEPEIGWQAEAIGRLQGEAHVLNMEIGGLERQLWQRDARIRDLETLHAAAAQAVVDCGKQNDALRLQVQQNKCEQQKGRIDFLETLNAGNDAAIGDYRTQVEKLQGLVDTARGQLEAAATERDELRAAIDAADKQLDQKDAQIRDLRIELDAVQQVPQPVSDEERERIWDDATEQAGRRVIGWLRPLTLALSRQPNERFSQFMVLTLSILPDVVPELLGYAVEDESLDSDQDCE